MIAALFGFGDLSLSLSLSLCVSECALFRLVPREIKSKPSDA